MNAIVSPTCQVNALVGESMNAAGAPLPAVIVTVLVSLTPRVSVTFSAAV